MTRLEDYLTTRRVRSDLIQTFKIINGINKADKSLFFEADSGGRRGIQVKVKVKVWTLATRVETASQHPAVCVRSSLAVACRGIGAHEARLRQRHTGRTACRSA